ncbi:ATP-grasp domain-containing protein [Luteolibacter flavescens]|uniref:ATP-grasp domain-containing protein n=1 Tax=Luteolibacter flavescens TaxID=1859460 RepID=A0ABT3FM34_9BACT|nr:ATP-grasp domain-containing protein [Luteolibacter flavescens]MCW1884623.1 ATP-grasp domain-containing protein [Luteolibacter flavescens]
MNPGSPIVLLGPRMTEDSVAVWRTCLDLGWLPERIQGWRVPQHLAVAGRPVMIYGEPLFAEAVADQTGLVLLEPSVEWLTVVPREYLQRDIELMSLGSARDRTSAAFVKPADGKIFEPKVYATGADLPTDEHVDMDIPVLRSGIVDFRLEVRCFVRGRQIVTLSPYWRDDELARGEDGMWGFLPDEEEGARKFAEAVLADDRVLLPPACTLDVGRLPDGSWAVIEANPCWGAGLYGCDPKEVLLSIQDAIIPRDSLTEESRRWVSKRRTSVLQ